MSDDDLLAEARKLVPSVGTDLVPAGGVHPERRAQARAALASPRMREILDTMAGYVAAEAHSGHEVVDAVDRMHGRRIRHCVTCRRDIPR